LRLLRILRPLKFISKNQNMRIVVGSLVESLGALLNVMIVIGMIWVMFAILGTNMMKDQMGYCSSNAPGMSIYGVNQEDCAKVYSGQWNTAFWNYDHIGNGLTTLFIASTLEGWPKLLGSALDADEADKGPQYNGSPYNGLFYIVFILIGSLFLQNLFIGVIFVKFSDEQKKEKQLKYSMVSEDQMKWIMLQELIQDSKPVFDLLIKPKGTFRNFVFKVVNSPIFEFLIMFCIILNIVAMGLVTETMSSEKERFLNIVGYIFTAIFFIEFVLKIIGLGVQYYKFAWNIFDFSIVISSKMRNLTSRLGRPGDGVAGRKRELPENRSAVCATHASPSSVPLVQADEVQAPPGHQ
jgi:hypothetical protein